MSPLRIEYSSSKVTGHILQVDLLPACSHDIDWHALQLPFI